MARTHLVIGDAHAKPGVSNERFTWLGKFIVDRRPDVVVDMGDWADMPSLSSYDKGKKAFEGRRYSRDVAANIDARSRVAVELKKAKKYDPELVALMGNHQQRILRASEDSPALDGTIGYADLRDGEFGWRVADYLAPVVLDGVTYSHAVVSGVKNLPIAGEYPAASILKKQFVSTTTAHSHYRDFAERTRGDGKKILGLVAGCYFTHREDYAGPANMRWWPGLILCHNVSDGYYDPEFISMKEIKKRYGKN